MSQYEGAIPRGILEQARARPVDPGRLQLLGKEAASLHDKEQTKLSEAVVSVIGKETLGPEQVRRVCEFANQSAFQNEWEKGGAVRNIEFEGGPADPSYVLQELNDGARQEAVRVSDYDRAPEPRSAADNRIEDQIFGKYASEMTHPSEVASGLPDLARLRSSLHGAQDHTLAMVSQREMDKAAAADALVDQACELVLDGCSLQKVATAWSHVSQEKTAFNEALVRTIRRLDERNIRYSAEMDKTAAFGQAVNTEHPLIDAYIVFEKTAKDLRLLKGAVAVLGENLKTANLALGIQS